MRRNSLLSGLAAATAALLALAFLPGDGGGIQASTAGAPARATRGEGALQRALDDLRARAAGPVQAVWSLDGSRIRTIRGAVTPPLPESPRLIADRFLSRHAALFRMRPDLADLKLAHIHASPAGRHFRFRQTYLGLPVFEAGVDIHIRRDGAVFLAHNRYAPGLTTGTIPAISAADAARLARRHAGGDGDAPVTELGIVSPDEDDAAAFARPAAAPLLAWRVILRNLDPAGARELLLDAHTGAVLRERDLAVETHFTGRGRVFDPNPVAYLGDPTLRDNDDADGPQFAPAYIEVPLPGLSRSFLDLIGPYALSGPHVRVTDLVESPFLPNVMAPDGAFLFTRDQDGFENVMTYFHIDRTQRYIQSLGFPDVNNRPIRVDPHGLRGARNAHYVGYPAGMGWIAFGTGGVDLAEDADVIWHEYGHAMQDNQNPGAYLAFGEAGAQGEGFGDYWAYVNTLVTGPALADPECIGEWSFEGCLRRTDSGKHYPEDIEREVHADGEIWSSVLRDLARALGPGAANRIILTSHFLVPYFPRFCAGTAALRDADASLNAGANDRTIATAAVRHGIGSDLAPGLPVLTPMEDGTLQLRFEIANHGTCLSGPVSYTVHLFGVVSGDQGEVASVTTGSIPPDGAAFGEFIVPGLAGEAFFYRIAVDPLDAEVETNEANNAIDTGAVEPASAP